MAPENTFVTAAEASATPSISPMVVMEAPRTVAMNIGSRLWISSEEMSMNIETRPNAHIPIGKTLNALNAAWEDWPVFVDGVFIRNNSKRLNQWLYASASHLFRNIIRHIRRCVAKTKKMPDADTLRIHAKSWKIRYVDGITDILSIQKFEIFCQYNKYQPVTDTLKSLALRVKVSNTILNIFLENPGDRFIAARNPVSQTSSTTYKIWTFSSKRAILNANQFLTLSPVQPNP